MALSDRPEFISTVGLILIYIKAVLYLLGSTEHLGVGLNFTYNTQNTFYSKRRVEG